MEVLPPADPGVTDLLWCVCVCVCVCWYLPWVQPFAQAWSAWLVSNGDAEDGGRTRHTCPEDEWSVIDQLQTSRLVSLSSCPSPPDVLIGTKEMDGWGSEEWKKEGSVFLSWQKSDARTERRRRHLQSRVKNSKKMQQFQGIYFSVIEIWFLF